MPRVLVIRHHLEDTPGLVGEAFAKRGYDVDLVMMSAEHETPSLDGYDVLTILGSKHAVYDPIVEEAWFGRELQVIDEANNRGIPILGICFGGQALCRYFGGTVAKAPTSEIGWTEITVKTGIELSNGPWFEYHFDRCELPAEAEVWAETDAAVQIFAIGKNVGTQFHPEIDEVQIKEWMSGVGGEETRDLGVDPDGLIEQTRNEEPAARERTQQLVDLFLARQN
jgi:GMP synthase-like glutamine amidotransferase